MSKVFKGTVNFSQSTEYKSLDIKFRGGYLVGENVTELRTVEEIKDLATTLLVVDVTLIFNSVNERKEYLLYIERVLKISEAFTNRGRMEDMIRVIASNDYLYKESVLMDRRVC